MQFRRSQKATDQSGHSAGPYPLTSAEPPRELEIHRRVNCPLPRCPPCPRPQTVHGRGRERNTDEQERGGSGWAAQQGRAWASVAPDSPLSSVHGTFSLQSSGGPGPQPVHGQTPGPPSPARMGTSQPCLPHPCQSCLHFFQGEFKNGKSRENGNLEKPSALER